MGPRRGGGSTARVCSNHDRDRVCAGAVKVEPALCVRTPLQCIRPDLTPNRRLYDLRLILIRLLLYYRSRKQMGVRNKVFAKQYGKHSQFGSSWTYNRRVMTFRNRASRGEGLTRAPSAAAEQWPPATSRKGHARAGRAHMRSNNGSENFTGAGRAICELPKIFVRICPHIVRGCGWESLMKSVTLGNVTMSHRTREARRMPCVSPTQL
ncbi:hypothetical protein EVAR_53552_1 [Eumeta japonica]|uniref:Uncharacterized protein n=1 Tax=Eumeta variegata TaxID=151549 RepID=A0A4C1YUN6_EUMVA|nr:hypothetical protein EVAR_53552_1 [Eumeta japonica]